MTQRVRFVLLGVLMGGALAVALHDHHASKDAQTGIYHALTAQLAAIRAGDYRGAREMAAREVRDRLGEEDFEWMLQTERRQLGRASHVEFGPVWRTGSRHYVEVFFVAKDGAVQTAVYTFLREEGAWRIRAAHMADEDRPGRWVLPGARA